MGGAFLTSTGDLFSLSVVVALLIGTLVGLVGGLLPGLSGVTVLTVLIPFVYHMSTLEALALLLSAYAVFTITGDITTTLVGIPSHPECAALVMDGYPMTRRGEGARALGASIASCGIGALIGAVLLALVGPLLKPLIVAIGQPQLFALLVVGLAMVGSLSGRKAIAGVGAAAFGVLLGTVGTNSQTGIIRYGFHQVYLVEGIPLVAFTLGMFAIPAVIEMHVRSRKGVAESPTPIGSDQWAGVRDVLRRPTVVLRGSLVGTVIGVIPGMGGAAAQWAAYGQAAQTSRHPEEFGQGAIDGVIAPSAACNAKEGGSLLPTIAFGVPGSAAMAVLLGVFTILGITPGPALLGEHLDITYFMVWMLVIANCIGCIACFIMLKPIAKVAFIPGRVVAPIVVCLLFIGAAAAEGQWGDIVTMLAAGAVGYAFRWAGWSGIPLVVGFILGGSIENALSLSVNIDGVSWLADPTVIVLLVIAVTIVVATAIRRRRHARAGGMPAALAATGAMVTADEPARNESLKSAIIALAVVTVAAVALVIAWTSNWPASVYLLPVVASTAMVLLGSVEAVLSLRRHLGERRRPTETPSIPRPAAPVDPTPSGGLPAPISGAEIPLADVLTVTEDEPALPALVTPEHSGRKALAAAGWLVGTALSAYVIGFTLSLPLFVISYSLVSRRRLLPSLLTAVAVGVVFYLVFVQALTIALPIPVVSSLF